MFITSDKKGGNTKGAACCRTLVSKDGSLSNSVNAYLGFDSLCVLWRRLETLFFDTTKVGSGVK